MKPATPKRLTAEDRILWSRVARTATPMPGKTYPEDPVPEGPVSFERMISEGTKTPPETPAAAKEARRPHRLDQPTHQKLARGRIEIAGRVDLHGLTQEEAHALLLAFLRQAYESERRHVLVITGKGSSRGEGVLRRAVPQWLATPPFAQLVSGFDEAARHHGGAGALYIRLRRPRVPQ